MKRLYFKNWKYAIILCWVMLFLSGKLYAYTAPTALRVLWVETGGTDQTATCHTLGDYITNVTFAGINNTTASSGAKAWHSDFGRSPQIAAGEVTIGQSYSFSVTLAGSDYSFDYVAVYVDWNQDSENGNSATGILDTNENPLLWYGLTGSGTKTLTGTITVPSGISTGQVYMRVMVDADSGESNGGDFTCAVGYGEFQDYVLNVSAASIAPTATTNAATSVSATDATLNGSINANSASTAVTFEYGLTNSYGSTVTATPSPFTGSSSTSVSAAITGLTANTTYHYRVVGVNAGGTTNGSDQTFTISTPSLTLTSNATDNTIVSGTSVTFTATPSGSTATNYLWKKNGDVISGVTSASFTTSDLVNGDVITAQLSANSGTIVNSNLVLQLDAGNQSSYPGSGATWTDISGNNNHATLPSDLVSSYSSSIGAGSFNFQGNSSTAIQSSAMSNWNITSTNALSVETWIKRTNYGDYHFWFSTPDLFYRLGVSNSGYLFWDMAHYTDRSSGILVTEGVWHHIVYTAGLESGNITTRVYLDGVPVVNQNEGISSLSTFTNYLIGCGQTPGHHPLNGNMGLIRVYNKTLSVSEVSQNYDAEVARFSTGVLSSNSITMTVNSAPPTVTTQAVSNIMETTATGNGTITELGTSNPTAYGICWNTTGTPTTADSKVDKGAASSTELFTVSITGLSQGTVYYARAFATNSIDTSYGDEVSFTTSSASLSGSTGGTSIAQNTPVYIASAAHVTGSTLNGAIVSISNNFVLGQDDLGIDGNTSTSTGSITYSYDSSKGILTLTGDADVAAYQTILRKVTYTNTSATPSTASRTVTISLNKALPYSGNGHYYEFKTSTGITWTNAKAAAEGLTYFGLKGYLATITSSSENTFCTSKLSGEGWIGASDATVEGTWRWVTGPEGLEDSGQGRNFYTGQSPTGAAVGSNYINWNTGEPSNSNNGAGYPADENYAHFRTDGTWNDYPGPNAVVSSIKGYVVEYGGSSDDVIADISDDVTVTIVKNPTSGGTIAADQAGCSPFNPVEISNSVLPSGHVGTLEYKWQSSTSSNSTGFSDISNSNAASYDPGSLTVDTWFKRLSSVGYTSDWTGAAESNVIKITVNPLPSDQTVTASPTTICSGNSATITVNSSEVGVYYTLRDNSNNTVVAGPKAGTGTALTLNTGALLSNKTYNVLAETHGNSTALSMDGVNEYVTTANVVMGNTWTYETMVKANDSSPDWSGIITSNSGVGTGMWFQIALDGNGKLRWESNNPTTYPGGIGPVINDNTWHHVAVTCDGSFIKFYTDGVLYYSQAFTGGTMDRPLIIMAERQPNQYIPGFVDQTMVWNYARSLTEIQSDRTTTLTGTETGLILYYTYENGTGTTVTDIAGGDHNGTLMNMENEDWIANGNPSFPNYSCPVQLTSTVTVSIDNPHSVSLSSAVGTNTQSTCINTAITEITYATTVATGISTATNLPAGVTATWALNKIAINGTPSVAGVFNYSIPLTGGCGNLSATGTITVNSLPAAPTMGSNSYTYSGIAKTASASVGTGETIDWYAAATGNTTSSVPTGTNVGTYSAYAEARNTTTGCVSANRTLVSLEVKKAELTVTADAQTKVYGDVNDVMTFQYSGWQNEDDAADLTTAPTASTTVTVTSPVDVYTDAITVSGGVSDNYSFSYFAADYEVTKAVLTVTADVQTKVYGEANDALTFQYSGWQNGDDAADLTTAPSASTTVTVTSPVNVYTDAITVSGGADENYSFSYIAADYEVTKTVLTVTADTKSKTYDGSGFSSFTSTITGFVNGETLSNAGITGSVMYSGAATTASDAGSYSITPVVTGLSAANYFFASVNGSLYIDTKTIYVTAVNKEKSLGGPDPVLTYTYSPNEIGSNLFTGSLTRTTGENLGTYRILKGTLSLYYNYDISFQEGTFSITDHTVPLWVTASGNLNRTVEYQDAVGLATAQALAPVANDNDATILTKVSGPFVQQESDRNGTYTNTWTAKDSSGNTSIVFTQVITIVDSPTEVSGTVSSTTGAVTDGIQVVLLKIGENNQTTVVKKIDLNGSSSFTFGGLPSGTYLLNVVVTDLVKHPDLLNTYYNGSSSVFNAQRIEIGSQNNTGIQLIMLQKTPVTSSGSISGLVTRKIGPATSGDTQAGQLAPDVDVVLKQDGKIVANTLTNMEGKYSFNLLPEGNYIVEVEQLGYVQDVIKKVTIAANSQNVVDVNFTIWATGTITKVNDLLMNLDIKMYPIPTSGKLNIISNKDSYATVSVFNASGKEVFHQNYLSGEAISIDLSRHVSGFYFVKLESNGESVTRKVILRK